MNNIIKGSIIGGVLMTILVVFAASMLLSGSDEQGMDAAPPSEEIERGPVGDVAPNADDVPEGVRPQCSGQGAAGVELPCLGRKTETPRLTASLRAQRRA